MSFVTITVRCSGPNCTHVKGPSNHWFKYDIHNRGIHFHGWQPGDEEIGDVMPLCGQECAAKVLQEFLSR